jgi:hypothetical protein
MAQAFAKTLKRDYAQVSPCPDAATVRRQLDGWFEHYNTVHPHKALGYRSPREFKEQMSDSATENAVGAWRMTAQCLRKRSGQARQPRAARRRKASSVTRAQPWTTHEEPNPVRLFRGNYRPPIITPRTLQQPLAEWKSSTGPIACNLCSASRRGLAPGEVAWRDQAGRAGATLRLRAGRRS